MRVRISFLSCSRVISRQLIPRVESGPCKGTDSSYLSKRNCITSLGFPSTKRVSWPFWKERVNASFSILARPCRAKMRWE